MNRRMPAGGKITLLNVPRHFIGSRYGMGYQMPLGLVSIGGPLMDAGFEVDMVDADVRGLSHADIIRELKTRDTGIAMLSHPASTAGYPAVEQLGRRIKAELPEIIQVYGGVFPTFAYREIMRRAPQIDYVVRGEGEVTAVELADCLRKGEDLSTVKSLVWRGDNSETVINELRDPIHDLDVHRFGWELVDWDLYHLFGSGPFAGIQFSRGCIYRCSYCGQWGFWRRYRHRTIKNFVDNLVELRDTYGVRHIFPADEHFCVDRRTTEALFKEIISRDIGIPLYVNTTVKDVLRDRDLMPIYKQAGVAFAALGIESDSPEVQRRINKGNTLSESTAAVGLLRRAGIIALIHMMYGLENETPKTVWRKVRSMMKIDADFVNMEYITPHFWTRLGRSVEPADIIQLDQGKWSYRNQVIRVPSMSPTALFWWVKLTELFIHLRPKILFRAWLNQDQVIRHFRRRGLWRAFKVWRAEIAEFYVDTKFAKSAEPAPSGFLSLVLNKRRDL